ncbi:MAG: VWA-like domain-containing protein [Pirellula sp.]
MRKKLTSPERMAQIVQEWFLVEPLLFGAWTTHQLRSNDRIPTIRVGRGQIEYNSEFLDSLDDQLLGEVMRWESIRIVLKHPYERRKPIASMAWEASNLAIRECIRSSLPAPTALERFGTHEHDRKFFEYYYDLLNGDRSDASRSRSHRTSIQYDINQNKDEGSHRSEQDVCRERGENVESVATDVEPSLRDGDCDGEYGDYGERVAERRFHMFDADSLGPINAANWDEDQWLTDQINDLIEEIEASQNWGTISGQSKELILATLAPKLDYRRVLSTFRATILSTRRALTRMKPSRRYGFENMGSRRDFSTRMLFAIDVSGSVASRDIQNACSIVNRFFKYGIETVDVIWFDTQIRCDQPVALKRAVRSISIDGRGGTGFQCVMDYLDNHRGYDGLIVFTDGIAPVPKPPVKNRTTRILWLFNHETNWRSYGGALRQPGMSTAFVLAD